METIAQRDHRMRVLGARLALRNGINSPKVSSSLLGVIEQSAEIIVAAFEREQCIVAEHQEGKR